MRASSERPNRPAHTERCEAAEAEIEALEIQLEGDGK